MPKRFFKSNTPMQDVLDIHTSAGALYRLISRVDAYLCGGCGHRINGGQVFGALGPDNPFDPAFEGSPLCMDCHLDGSLGGVAVDSIHRHFVPVDELTTDA